ncbi:MULTISPECIES: hypothetical protein [Nocardioides]|uniref:DUF4034 domain-containing protein n=1 Tax=Nocardioides lianchengensis TaxID=1045774 RepID=A0A1G6QX17_9ACTN|nr:hypothetical protein [Nocardioides lianchengensis]NYG10465.1 hypothetical protein [Nocardioides lianchengensis]SDC96534.1 hypothetical protein SAMN05421872_10552 [Nocardioides lianchengensis]
MPLFSRRPDTPVQVDPHLAADLPLISAAHEGDAHGLAERLSVLRQEGRWHHRHQLVARAARADRGTGWIETWAGWAPGDPDALVARAVTALRIARAAEGAEERLQDASLVVEAAISRAPEDPTTWSTALELAHASEAGPLRIHDVITQAATAAPAGFAWRSTAVELLSSRWFGSLEESWDFAVTSAEIAPQSRLVLLPAYAALSQLRRERTDVAEEMLTEALPPALGYLEASRADEADHVEAASSIAARLVAASRRREAPAVLDLLGDRVDTVVWGTVVGPDPVGAFTGARRAYR